MASTENIRRTTRSLSAQQTGTWQSQSTVTVNENTHADKITPEKAEQIRKRARRLSGIIKEKTNADSCNQEQLYQSRVRHNSERGGGHLSRKEKQTTSKSLKERVIRAAKSSRDIRNLIQNNDFHTSTRDCLKNTMITTDVNHDKTAGSSQSISVTSAKPSTTVMDSAEATLLSDERLSTLMEVLQEKFEKLLQEHTEAIKTSIQKEFEPNCALQKSVSTNTTCITDINAKVEAVENNLNNKDSEVEKLQKSLDQVYTKITDMSEVIVRQDMIIRDLQDRQDTLEEKQQQNNIVISGLPEVDKENCLATVIEFFQNTMNVKQLIYIQTAYRLGKKKPDSKTDRPMVVELQRGEKTKIYECLSNLKGKKNSKGKYYKVKDQRPQKISEREARYDQIKAINKKSVAEKVEISFKKGRMYMGNTVYKKQVTAPTAKDILDLTSEERERVMKVKLTAGDTVQKENCKFYGYTTTVKTHQQIRDAYLQLRIKHSRARHIVCAYRLRNGHFSTYQDFDDDEEHGMGKTLLRILENAEIFSRCIFVVRYYGGEHINEKRYEGYKEATEAAILLDPWNPIEGTEQTPYPVHPPTKDDKQATTPPEVREKRNQQWIAAYGSTTSPQNAWNVRQQLPQTTQQMLNAPGTTQLRAATPLS